MLFSNLSFQTLEYFFRPQTVLNISVLVWYVKWFIGLRRCSDCGRMHHLPKSFGGPRGPPDPQPKIKGNNMTATLSKFVCTHPPPPQQQFAQKEKNGEKHTSASRAISVRSITCSSYV